MSPSKKLKTSDANLASQLIESPDKADSSHSIKNRKKSKKSISHSYLCDPYHPSRPVKISIAVSGTIVENAKSATMKAVLCGQIARSAAIFNIDEILIYSDSGSAFKSEGCGHLNKILNYLECPQYLRRVFYSKEKWLDWVGVIPPIAMPHHPLETDQIEYREGVTLSEPFEVDIGLSTKINCNMNIAQKTRVTCKLEKSGNEVRAQIVSPNEPKTNGLYWGYTTRMLESLESVLTSNEFDLIIGTSDKGVNLSSLETLKAPSSNILIVFGGVCGLEEVQGLRNLKKENFLNCFSHYVNIRPSQGTKTIRAEEAIPLTLAALEPLLLKNIKSLNLD